MELSTLSYDTTPLDFTGFRRAEPTLSSTFVAQMMTAMLGARSAKDLSDKYTQYLSTCLPLQHISVRSDSLHWHWANGIEVASSRIHLSLHEDNATYNPNDEVIYGFSHELSPAQRGALNTLHPLYCLQVRQINELTRLQGIVTKDGLTGLGNRAGYDEACHRMILRHQRSHKAFGLLVIDLDNFKAVNDTHGHLAGDQVLRAVGQTIQSVLRGEDMAFRFGGDEFCCLLNCQSERSLGLVAQRLQRAIQQQLVLQRHGISCSIGGAIITHDDDHVSLFERADHALYQVKQTGKNAFKAA